MDRWGALALASSLLAQTDGTQEGARLLTAPQRDAVRPRTAPATADVSADGRYIAFASYAALVPADTGDRADIYVLDRQTGAVTLESFGADGRLLPGDTGHPRLSGDGRYVVFDTAVIADAEGTPTLQVFLRDRVAGTTRLLSAAPDGRVPNGRSGDPAISADGTAVVFSSSATDLVTGRDENGPGLDVYLYEVGTEKLRRISVDSRGLQRSQGSSYAPSVSGTGQYVAFVSTADLPDSHDTLRVSPPSIAPKPFGHIYVRDVRAGTTARITEPGPGIPANGGSWAPAISADGRHVAFASVADNLVLRDRNRAADVFVHDRQAATTTLVSRSARRGSANGASINPAISADGRVVAFQSDGSDLICAGRCRPGDEDINLLFDVYVYDRQAASMRRLSGSRSGGWLEESGGAATSADGNVIVFTSRHPIDRKDAGNDFDLYVAVAAGQQEIRR